MKRTLILMLTLLLASITGFADEVMNVDAEKALEILKQQSKPKVIDVRTAEEFAAGHIEGAVNIDVKKSDFKQKLSALDKEQTYLVHCRSGARSTRSLRSFKKLGFKNIIHLDGGILAWEDAGGKTVK